MAREQHIKAIDISNIPELLRLVEEVRSTNEPRMLRPQNQDMAIVRPVKRPSRPRIPRGKPFTKDDPIWDLAGQVHLDWATFRRTSISTLPMPTLDDN